METNDKKTLELLTNAKMEAKTFDKNEIEHFINNAIDCDKTGKLHGYVEKTNNWIYFLDLEKPEESHFIFDKPTGELYFKGTYNYFISNPFFKFDISKWDIKLTETEKILKYVI